MHPAPKAFLLGVAAGSRSTLGLATVAFACRPDPVAGIAAPSGPPTVLRSTGARALATGLVVLEMVGDKLPSAPSRLEGPGLGSRVVCGLLGGALLVRRTGTPVVVGAALAAAGVALGAFGGAAVRRALADRLGHDLPAALLEDATALALHAVAARG